jgi:hypothetical protein
MVSNAIERLNGRLRNEGSIAGSPFPSNARLRGDRRHPVNVGSCRRPRLSRKHELVAVSRFNPATTVIVLQDMDRDQGPGALVGEIHAMIGIALKCVGYVTNGAVRDLAAIDAMGFICLRAALPCPHKYAMFPSMECPSRLADCGFYLTASSTVTVTGCIPSRIDSVRCRRDGGRDSLMRDIEHYHMFRVPGASPAVLDDLNDSARRRYLDHFADFEGRTFLRRFYQKYKGQTPDQTLRTLVFGSALTPLRAAVIFRSIRPQVDVDQFGLFLRAHLPASVLARKDYRRTI